MLDRLGIRDWRDLILWLCLVLLVAVTPAGKEATHPLVLGIYRTLLLVIIGLYFTLPDRSRLPRLSPYFCAGLIGLAGISLISILHSRGSLFEGFYFFYFNVLFVAAFVALAHSGIMRRAAWKHSVLVCVVLINLGYMAGALLLGKRPMLGPFVNPNYLASFVLPGLAICSAAVLLATSLRLRIVAAAAGILLYYGIGQASSRGATLAALTMLGLAGFRFSRRRGFSLLRMALVTSLLVMLTIAINPALVRKFLDRGERDPYNYQRAQIWVGTLAMIWQHPLTGVGLGHFSDSAKSFAPPAETTIARYPRYPNIAHSEYLQYVAEIGIPGALLLFGLGAGLFTLAWRRAGSAATENSVVQESALLTAVGLGAHALVDNNWVVPVMAAGLAVISQADLLPHDKGLLRATRSPMWRHAMALVLLAVWMDAAMIPSIGLYFNRKGHEAYALRSFNEAELNHRYALAVLPKHPVLLDNLGMVYFDEFLRSRKMEYLDRAEDLFSESMAQNPDFDVAGRHLEAALIQRLTSNPELDARVHLKIIEVDRHLLGINPFNPFVRKNLAEALYNLGSRHHAREELLKAIEIEPNYVPAYLRLAEWSEEAGQTEESARYRSHAVQVVNLYKDKTSLEPLEAMLLGRPQSPAHP
jgi:O-antigen ligase